MKKTIYITLFSISTLLFIACGAYSFTGGNTGEAKTIQIDFFTNQAPLVEPVLTQRFTNDFQDLFTRQTNLTLTNSNGDLYFSGEIINYRVTPMSGTSAHTAAQNRFTHILHVLFVIKLEANDDFEQSFSFYSDFAALSLLTVIL